MKMRTILELRRHLTPDIEGSADELEEVDSKVTEEEIKEVEDALSVPEEAEIGSKKARKKLKLEPGIEEDEFGDDGVDWDSVPAY